MDQTIVVLVASVLILLALDLNSLRVGADTRSTRGRRSIR
jgi:hypothetical protein